MKYQVITKLWKLNLWSNYIKLKIGPVICNSGGWSNAALLDVFGWYLIIISKKDKYHKFDSI